jgi:tetratricopeptide (TPR) repeat protein
MPGVFLSYRRKDGDYAVLLYAWLTEKFGADQVFWDREDIDPGSDFRKVLSDKLRTCDALVAMIGPGWSPSPWIQREIRASLKRCVLVLPVLLGDSPNLDAAALPKSIRQLASLQTLETRDLRFRDRLIDALVRSVNAPAKTATQGNTVAIGDIRARRLIDLLRDQTDDRQRRALELLQQGQTDGALAVLNETFDLLMALIDFQPGDPNLELRLGFLYKDLAQVFENTDRTHFLRYVQSGLQTFQRLVALDLPANDMASSWNGLGNIHLLREDFDKAVDCCQRALSIVPDYSNAWSDLFMAYEGQARNGHVNLPGMRRALARLKATSRGDTLLAPAITAFQTSLRQWELRTATRGTSKTRSPRPRRVRTRQRPRR